LYDIQFTRIEKKKGMSGYYWVDCGGSEHITSPSSPFISSFRFKNRWRQLYFLRKEKV